LTEAVVGFHTVIVLIVSHEQLHLLSQAAADNDAVAEEQGIEAALRSLGLTPEDVKEVAEQRALRLVRLLSGGGPVREADFISLSPMQREFLAQYTALYMDGIAIGWRAANAARD
jgi:hypothetical protein